jgi:hypothetical protein
VRTSPAKNVQAYCFMLWIPLSGSEAGLRPFSNFTLSGRATFAMSERSETLATTYGQRPCFRQDPCDRGPARMVGRRANFYMFECPDRSVSFSAGPRVKA